jgi:hypothetical protein
MAHKKYNKALKRNNICAQYVKFLASCAARGSHGGTVLPANIPSKIFVIFISPS